MSVSRIVQTVGTALRAIGASCDRAGSKLIGNIAFKENLNRHRRIMNFLSFKPSVGNNVFVAPSAHIIGQVELKEGASVWYGAVLRGDLNQITVGSKTNIQDRVVVHVSGLQENIPTKIGERVTIEPGAVIHACTLEDGCVIGVGATVLDRAVIEKNAMIAPNSVVASGVRVPSGELWSGIPAKFLRKLTAEEIAAVSRMAEDMHKLSLQHAEEHNKDVETTERELETTDFKNMRLRDYVFEPPYTQAPREDVNIPVNINDGQGRVRGS